MFSKIVLLSALVAVALCAVVQEPVPILAQNQDVHPDGTYQYSFESGDGTSQQQSGVPKPVGKDEVAEVVSGSASFTDPAGGTHSLTYVADENGYQPVGSDIPVAPEVPAAIARALDYIAAHPQPEEH